MLCWRISMRTIPVLLAVGLMGCSSPPTNSNTVYIPEEQGPSRNFSLALEPVEARHQVGNEWGVALSGGGIRSALFNLGLLKWMYDSRFLDRIDIISSVSGGGYTAYWLYANQAANPSVPRFAYGSLDESQFSKSVCEILVNGNFVTNWDIAGAVANPFDRAHDMYERKLQRTFGVKDHHLTVSDLQRSLQGKARVPYWILNSTLVDPAPKEGWADGLFEMTPLLKGNHAFRYSEWQHGQDIWLLEAVAVSGAAVREVIKQHVPNPIPQLYRPTIEIDDGGHSENLGAVALIRRGVKNIVIGDGEHDPKWDFPAYRNLQARLRRWGVKLEIRDLDTYLTAVRANPQARSPKHTVYKGTVTNTATNYSGTVYYIKMARSEAAERILTLEMADTSTKKQRQDKIDTLPGASVNENYMQHLERTGVWSKNAQQPITWNCNQAPDMKTERVEEWLQFAMASNELNVANSKLLSVGRWFGRGAVYSDFPMHTTADQSFFLRQSLAFLGLGYVQASQLKTHLPERATPSK